MSITIPFHLTDDELTAEVLRCARDEGRTTARLVAHLAEFDARRLYLPAGCSSLFAYCCKVLGLSEHATYNRIEAARLARRYPEVLNRLSCGSLNLTTLRLLAPHLTDANHEELLRAAAHRGRREIEELVAQRFPQPDTPSSVRKVPERRPASAPGAARLLETTPAPTVLGTRLDVSDEQPSAPAAPPAQPPRPLVKPLSTDRYEIRFTASGATRDKLKVAQDLLRHSVPTGDPAEIIDRALSALIEELARRKLAIVRRPQRSVRKTADGSRHIPSDVKRAVWARDGGRCAYIGSNGRRCDERAFLELHHVEPYAVGGAATVENIALRCRAHNAHEAQLFFGSGRPTDGSGRVNENGPVSWRFHSF